ncbi:MAG: hypothetical protein HY319_20960 [Armatimonadetes bacterium]|nr:hypothetical protein [Armatimonadota bacterium]
MRRLLTHILLLIWSAAPALAESPLESALQVYLPPNDRLRASLEQALQKGPGADPSVKGYVTANRQALDRALKATRGSGSLLPPDFQEYERLQDLGLALAARGALEGQPDDILAVLEISKSAYGQKGFAGCRAGQHLARAALRALATWVDGATSAPPLEETLGRLKTLQGGLPCLSGAISTELNRAKREVSEVCRDPSAGGSGEEFQLLRRLGTPGREMVLREFSRLSRAYATLADRAIGSGSIAPMQDFLGELQQVRDHYRKGARRVVAPSPEELARALAAALLPDLSGLVQESLWTQAYASAVPVLVRLKVKELESGQFPPDLTALGGPPADPFGGKMVYAAGPGGIRLYSLGPDQQDQGGKHDLPSVQDSAGSDIVFILGAPP